MKMICTDCQKVVELTQNDLKDFGIPKCRACGKRMVPYSSWQRKNSFVPTGFVLATFVGHHWTMSKVTI